MLQKTLQKCKARVKEAKSNKEKLHKHIHSNTKIMNNKLTSNISQVPARTKIEFFGKYYFGHDQQCK